MKDRMLAVDNACDRVLALSLIVPAVLMPVPAFALQVGCFFTAFFLGIMFLICLVMTEIAKCLIARYVWRLPKIPWLRLFALTWLELFVGILVFASVRTSFWLSALIYLPIAALINRFLLARFTGQAAAAPATAAGRIAVFLLFAAVLPLSLQVSGVLWHTVTNAITFTEIQ